MAYVTQQQIQTALPAPLLVDALDDDKDGSPDDSLLDQIIAQASQAVDAYLAGLFTVPFADPAPAPVAEAAFVFACEKIYQRRGVTTDTNPFTKTADYWRDRLQKIGNRELPLDATKTKIVVPGAVITENTSINTQTT